MKPIHLAFVAIAIALATGAEAVTVTNTYTFAQPNQMVNSQGAVGGTAAYDGGYTGYNATSGTNYGNYRVFGGTGSSSVQVSAWGSTGAYLYGGTTGYDRAIQSAFVSQYSNGSAGTGVYNELGITSRPDTNTSGAANNELLNCGVGSTNCTANSGDYEHAMDNIGGYEALEFAFGSAVTLSNVSIGFPTGSTPDSDATVLVYTGTGTPTLGGSGSSARTFADLVAPGGGWAIAGNLSDLANGGTSGNLSPTVASKYWMVGAYMAIGGNATASVGNDAIKLTSITVKSVPEPDSLALFGIAGAAWFAGRRRARRQG